MFIREIWGKFTSFIFWNFEISFVSIEIILKSPSFQKSELGKFIPNFSLKYVITRTNQTIDCNQHCTVNGVIL